MANIFASIARKETTLSPLMENKERMSIDDVISTYPDGVTINGFDMISTGGDSYPVLTFSEDDTKFIFGGAIMNNICHGWLEHFEGDTESANSALKASGGVSIRFTKSRTKSGNNITLPEILTR